MCTLVLKSLDWSKKSLLVLHMSGWHLDAMTRIAQSNAINVEMFADTTLLEKPIDKVLSENERLISKIDSGGEVLECKLLNEEHAHVISKTWKFASNNPSALDWMKHRCRDGLVYGVFATDNPEPVSWILTMM